MNNDDNMGHVLDLQCKHQTSIFLLFKQELGENLLLHAKIHYLLYYQFLDGGNLGGENYIKINGSGPMIS